MFKLSLSKKSLPKEHWTPAPHTHIPKAPFGALGKIDKFECSTIMIFGGQGRRVGGYSDVRFLFVIHPSSARALVLGAAYLTKKTNKKVMWCRVQAFTHMGTYSRFQ